MTKRESNFLGKLKINNFPKKHNVLYYFPTRFYYYYMIIIKDFLKPIKSKDEKLVEENLCNLYGNSLFNLNEVNKICNY